VTPPQAIYRKPEIRTDGTSAAAYGPTYFPGAASTERATVVEAVSGAEVTGLEIRLSRQHTVTVSGVVRGAPSGSLASVNLRLGENPYRLNDFKSVSLNSDAKFSFPDVGPGIAIVYATTFGGSHLQSQILELKPDSTDISNLELTLLPGVELAGTVLTAGEPSNERLTVALQPTGATSSVTPGISADVDAKGAFRFANVYAGKYKVKVQPFLDDTYIAAVHLDEAEAPNGELDLSQIAAGSKLKIELRPDGGQIDGTVQDRDGRPLINSTIGVLLANGPADLNPENVMCSARGTFHFRGLRPGKYKLIAVDGSGSGGEEAMKKLLAAADDIEVKPGVHLTPAMKLSDAK
jgi:hypothetical protein